MTRAAALMKHTHGHRNSLTSRRRDAQQVCLTFQTTAATSSRDRKQLRGGEYKQAIDNESQINPKRKTVNQLYTIQKCAYDRGIPTMGPKGKILLISNFQTSKMLWHVSGDP